MAGMTKEGLISPAGSIGSDTWVTYGSNGIEIGNRAYFCAARSDRLCASAKELDWLGNVYFYQRGPHIVVARVIHGSTATTSIIILNLRTGEMMHAPMA